MASPTVVQGIAVTRQWDEVRGLKETEHSFLSLDELYAFCLALESPSLIDRIVLHGNDGADRPVTLTFEFQSISTPDQ